MRQRAAMLVIILACGSLAHAQPPASMPTSAPATMPAALPAADQMTPKGTLRLLFAATDSGDPARIKALLYAVNPEEEKMGETMSNLANAVAGLRKALKDTFGDEQTKALLGDSAVAANLRDQNLASAPEKIEGETATVQLQTMGPYGAISLQRISGQWKIHLAGSTPIDPKMMEEQMKVTGLQASVIRAVTGDVGAQKFKSVADVKQTLDARVKQAIMEYIQERQKAAPQPSTLPATMSSTP